MSSAVTVIIGGSIKVQRANIATLWKLRYVCISSSIHKIGQFLIKEYHTLKAQIADENALKSAAQFNMHH